MNPPALLAMFNLGVSELFLILCVFVGFPFWIWMIVDCAMKEEDTGNKTAWLLIILLVGFIGAPLYFFVRKLPRQPKEPARPRL